MIICRVPCDFKFANKIVHGATKFAYFVIYGREYVFGICLSVSSG